MISRAMALVPKRFTTFFSIPLLRRAAFHVKRLTSGMDSSFFVRVGIVLGGFLIVASALVTLTERDRDGYRWESVAGFFREFLGWLYWSITTVMGSGDASQVDSPVGYAISWLLILFGVAIVASLTGALVGFLIDYLLKEGQGMGASGYRDHIIVCGWNSTARELIQELSTDEYTTKIVVIHDSDKNPAGEGVYFVSGDITTAHDLKRAGIEDAQAAVVCPADGSQRGRHEVDPLRDGDRVDRPEGADRRRGQQPRARRALPARRRRRDPGLLAAGLPADGPLVALPGAGRAGHRHRLRRRGLRALPGPLPDDYVGLSVDELSAKLRAEHRATLLSISRGGQAYVNPPDDFRLANGDDLVVVAESLGSLAPLEMDHDLESQ